MLELNKKYSYGERSLRVYEQFSYTEALGIDMPNFISRLERTLLPKRTP